MTTAETGAEIAHIERALGALLTAMQEDEARWPEPALFHIRAGTEIGQLLQEPVYFACRLAVRRLGERAHAVAGGADGMRRIAERVADAKPEEGGRFLSMMDSAWDGVGTDADRWWM